MGAGSLVVNEIAPRSHNSGHYTIEACPTFSQYKAHLLAILDLVPSFPNSTIATLSPTVMLNVLGGKSRDSHAELVRTAVAMPSAALHMYGKEPRPARKIGHITVVANSMSQCKTSKNRELLSLTLSGEELISPLIRLVDDMRAERKGLSGSYHQSAALSSVVPSPLSSGNQPLVAVTMGSDSDLPVL